MSTTNTITMSFNDISPHVRYVNLIQCSYDWIVGPRVIYDHEFVYIHGGKGTIEIDNVCYKVVPGDLFFYGPLVNHTLASDQEDPFFISGIHFDFTKKYKDRPFPLGSLIIENFREELVTERVNFTDFSGFPTHINLSSEPQIRNLIIEMAKEYEGGKIYYNNYLNSLFSLFVTAAARHIVNRNSKVEIKEGILNQIIEFIQNNYNKNLSNEDIGEKFHFHPNYLNQLMVAHTGVSLHQYLVDFRIKKAVEMILNSNLTVSEISQTVGYDNVYYFFTLFKKKTGFTPSEIRNF